MKKPQTTAQRTAIMAYLKGNKSHPSVNDVYQAVAKQLTGISLTTVYNNMMLLAEQGFIKEVPTLGRSGKRFDSNVTPHDHFICISCHMIVDIHLQHTPIILQEPPHGFEIHGITSNLFGLCPVCKNKSKAVVGL